MSNNQQVQQNQQQGQRNLTMDQLSGIINVLSGQQSFKTEVSIDKSSMMMIFSGIIITVILLVAILKLSKKI